MPALPVISAVGAIGGLALGAAGLKQQKDAASQAAEAAKNAGVNIPQVAQEAQDQAYKNAINSAALEQQLNPLAPQLRTASLQSLIQQLKSNPLGASVEQGLLQNFQNGAPGAAPAFTGASQGALTKAAQDEAMRQLQLGGKLDQETANQVIRSSAARAGGYGNTLGLGRDLSARDLGLTSLQLQQQRAQTAAGLGQQQDVFNSQQAAMQNQYGLGATSLGLQGYGLQNQLGMGLYGLGNNDFLRALQAAQFGQGIAQPVTGLDPSAIANLAVGNANSKTSAAQNAAGIAAQGGSGLMGFGGQLAGFGLGGLAGYNQQPAAQPWSSFQSNGGYQPGSISAALYSKGYT